MIQSRSLPGHQVSSSLTGGGAQRKLGARFACCVMAPEGQYGREHICLRREFSLIALFVVRSRRIYCLSVRNRGDRLARSPGRVVVAEAPRIRSRMATLKRFRYGRHAYLGGRLCLHK